MRADEKTVSVKYFRHPSGDHSSYGAPIDARLDALLQSEQARSSLRLKARARVPGISIIVERHEDGPFILGVCGSEDYADLSPLWAWECGAL